MQSWKGSGGIRRIFWWCIILEGLIFIRSRIMVPTNKEVVFNKKPNCRVAVCYPGNPEIDLTAIWYFFIPYDLYTGCFVLSLVGFKNMILIRLILISCATGHFFCKLLPFRKSHHLLCFSLYRSDQSIYTLHQSEALKKTFQPFPSLSSLAWCWSYIASSLNW